MMIRMAAERISPVRRAVILAAGMGGRLGGHTASLPKPLVPVGGRPLISYTLEALHQIGVREAVVITGYREAQLRKALASGQTLPLTLISNPRYESGASYSLGAARQACGSEPFLLVMSDHLLSAGLLSRLAAAEPQDACRVAADASPKAQEVVDEATRLAIDTDGRVRSIGKDISPYTALDTGAFACTAEVWEALDAAPEGCDLSTVFRELAGRGRLYAADVSGEFWYDVDTSEDLAAAESLLTKLHA